MANISPGVYTKIIDLSTFVQIVPSTIGFICALTEKGEDNKLKFLSSRSELVDEFGPPNISAYGQQYGQGPYVAYNYLGESGSLYFMRCLPDDATYSNLRIYANSDTTTALFMDYVPNLNSTADITTAMQVFGNNTPLVIFYPIGRGVYYNNIGIEITEDETHTGEGVYNLDIYETQSDGSYTLIESFKISFDNAAISTNPGESIYVEHVLETYSKVLRAKVGKNGFDLIDKIYTTEVHTSTPIGQDVTDVSVSSHGSTSYIDTTTIVYIDTTSIDHIPIYIGSSWTTANSLNQARHGLAGCGGSTTGALAIGGGITGQVATTEKWSTPTYSFIWVTTSALNIARYYLAGCGDVDDALAIGGALGSGLYTALTEIWNGATWATTSNIPHTTQLLAACGNTGSALSFGGSLPGRVNYTQTWNGSAWTSTTIMSVSTDQHAGCGTILGALAIAGYSTAISNKTQKWQLTDVYVWSTTSSLVKPRVDAGGLGIETAALCVGGDTGSQSNSVEKWDGSTWTATSNYNQTLANVACCGSTLDALAFGGYIGLASTNNTSIWNGSGWATTTVLNTARLNLAGCGLTSGALSIGGSGGYSVTEIWNGSSWATTTALTQGRTQLNACGITSAAMCMGGYTSGTPGVVNTTEIWNGSGWATTTVLNTTRDEFGCGGVTTAAIAFGGNSSISKTNSVELWNGSSWSLTSALNNARTCAGCGTTSAALEFGTGTVDAFSEVWLPTQIYAWATTSTVNTANYRLAGCGTTLDAFCFGGNTGAVVQNTEKWNGSTWATTSNLNVGRQYLAGCGNTTDALSFGGGTTGVVNTTEIWGSTYITHDVVRHHIHEVVYHHRTPVITDLFQLTDAYQDFTPWSTDPETGTALFVAIVKDSFSRVIWGWLGSTSENGTVVNIWKDNNLDTSTRGWNGDVSTFDYSDENITYQVKKSKVSIPDLFSVKTLRKGSDGSLILKGTFDEDVATQILSQGYAGLIDDNVTDTDGTYFSLVYDAGYPKDVKDQIVGLAQARGDCVAIIDNGDNISVNSSILSRKNNYQYNTYYASIYESYNRIFDIFTERQVWFSPCYHLGYILPRSDKVGELWYAASGNNRGSCRDIKELRFSPSQSQRDILYTYQINPIIKQNTDYVLWGQLTSQSKASALQDLNIVRLLLYIKRGVQQYANNFIFDDNSQLVWNTVKNNITDFLEQIKKRRGLINYTVNVGATLLEMKNKTFHVDIILEPTGTTEKIELNFYIK